MKTALVLFLSTLCLTAAPVKLAPGPSPADNPLKGLVPYAEPESGCFPHSLEFNYVRFSDLMKGVDSFVWQPFEKLLNGIVSRGNQAVFRVWIEYPDQKSGLPKFLRDQGVKITEWTETEKKPREKICYTPGYEDERLIGAMEVLIAALGKRYDGDARIGYITAGLLGSWGEWHTYPREDLFASEKTRKRVLAAYAKAFKKTPVLLRYPVGPNREDLASNAEKPFDYHDDSFAWGTLDTGKEEHRWFYPPSMKRAASPNAGPSIGSSPACSPETLPERGPSNSTPSQSSPATPSPFESSTHSATASPYALPMPIKTAITPDWLSLGYAP
ncbi:hypothetical protein [Prosthecobacter sp.]|uniref:hypothetical protein n=1 Tax=Prosthecobacter sp. TaxID=1965333 RepID=UPI00248A665A|nr:hypothetical protein [Prosthecobacter sp.]MDI1311832.1 hypothetical protein [Prosthecobacter sp.]